MYENKLESLKQAFLVVFVLYPILLVLNYFHHVLKHIVSEDI